MKRLLAMLLAGAAVACTGDNPPQRDCLARVWVHPSSSADVRVIGDWDNWARPGIAPEPHEDGWRLARFELPPGEHGYLLDLGDETMLDPQQPMTTFDLARDAREVSLLQIGDCAQPRLDLGSAEARDGAVTLDATFLANRDASPLTAVTATTHTGRALDVVFDADTGAIAVTGAMDRQRETVDVVAEDDDGNAVSARVTVWDGGRDPRDEVIYQVMIDRFSADGGAPLSPPRHAGARAGGTLDGVRSSLSAITDLGATALWLSPVYQGPDDERLGNDGRLYEGYHGYWPIDSRAVDTRIGGEEALDALLADAHEQRLAVLLDVVPNHVYETHPRFAEQASEGWFHPSGCVCGTDACPWHEHIQDCWFTPYLPDFRLEHPDALAASIDDVAWWTERFALDGVRVDAVPMMPRAASRKLAQHLRQQDRGEPLLLGEIFTGPGPSGLAQLKRHLGPAGMNSVFDFPLMWAMHDAIATGRGGFGAVEAVLVDQEHELEGSGAILARIVDNHDTPRFISVANGDGFGDPWAAPAEQPAHAEPYRRLELALALIFTLPGMPVVFQGDEIGLAGANDPDCRRVMPAENALNEHQRALRESVRALGKLRGKTLALRRGSRTLIEASDDRYVFARGDGDEIAVIALSTSSAESRVRTAYSGAFVDALSGEEVDVADFALPPMSFRIVVPQTPPRP